jgi:hypothetical protein
MTRPEMATPQLNGPHPDALTMPDVSAMHRHFCAPHTQASPGFRGVRAAIADVATTDRLA